MMPRQQFIKDQAEPLVAILTAQCSDLEALLTLARTETAAVERCDFAEVMRVVEQRAALGSRLEVYHRQIAEMRQQLGDDELQPILNSALCDSAVRLATEVQAQDARTRPLLQAAGQDASQQLSKLSQSRRTIGAYLNEGPAVSIACDQHV